MKGTNVVSIRPDSGVADSKSHHLNLALAALNLMAATGTAIYLSARFGTDLSGQPLALAGLLFTGGLVLIDLAWLGLILSRWSRRGASANHLQRFSPLRALSRPHSLIAWLVFHSAVIPLLFLGPKSGTLQLSHYLAFLLAVLIMGLLPVGLIVWLDTYLARKLQD